MNILHQIKGKLIVSCQALPDEPLHGSEIMAKMALAAFQGGAAGIRANTPSDIAAIKRAVSLPIIGLYKDGSEGVYITPTFDHAKAIAEAEIIALDATPRPRPDGSHIADLIQKIHRDLDRLVLADVSTLEEAIAAEKMGADLVAPTLAGYTPYSPKTDHLDLDLLRAMVQQVSIPVIAEGGIHTPELAKMALEAGAYAVVVGGAITRPQQITARFVNQLKQAQG